MTICRKLKEAGETDNKERAREEERPPDLQRVFWKVRPKVAVQLRSQLTQFRETRGRGLGRITLGGVTIEESDLEQCKENRHKELQIIDQVLCPVLEKLV